MPYEIPLTRDRLKSAFKFMKLLRVEPYLFLIVFQLFLKLTPANQLIQDKICKQWYPGTTDKYCLDLPTSHESGDAPDHFKSRILADAAQFGTYSTYLTTLPILFWAMFVGSWIDRYVRGRKILMLLSVGATSIENIIAIILSIKFDASPYLNLLLHIPTALFGGHVVARIAITHYQTSTTPPKLLAIRFMIFEMCFFVASPIGSSLGGYILVQSPVIGGGAIRNYTMCFILALGFEVLAFLWILFMINEKVARKQEMKIEMKIKGIKGEIGKDVAKVKLKSDMRREDEDVHPIKLFFNLENIKSMFGTVFKKRPNKVRKQLFLLFASMTLQIMALNGIDQVTGQFIQKVYFWPPDWKSYIDSMSMVIHSIGTISIVPILIKVVKVNDLPLDIIGYSLGFIKNVIQGSWMSPTAYYISMVVGSASSVSSIGIRSHMTKIVDRDEIGKIMSFIATLDTLAPMIGNTIFTYIFKYTIDTYPGTVFQITALLLLIPIGVMIWIDLYTDRPLNEMEGPRHGDHRRKHNSDENENEDVQECDLKKGGEDDDETKSHGHEYDHEINYEQEGNGGQDGDTVVVNDKKLTEIDLQETSI